MIRRVGGGRDGDMLPAAWPKIFLKGGVEDESERKEMVELQESSGYESLRPATPTSLPSPFLLPSLTPSSFLSTPLPVALQISGGRQCQAFQLFKQVNEQSESEVLALLTCVMRLRTADSDTQMGNHACARETILA
ncbi:hypothetical protein NQZ68_002385 [Dissostichus eleginoides]|nr:hypothetical protein NQZ68_002385 [Dissostichus eleginoides]